MINTNNLALSKDNSKKRIALANSIIGAKLVLRIIGLALYLLGATRKSISELLDIPYDTFKSFTQRIEQHGIAALVDRRNKGISFTEVKQKPLHNIQMKYEDNFFIINLGPEKSMKIPETNKLQIKTLLLTMLDNNILDSIDVAEALGYSQSYVKELKKKSHQNDDILIDKRQGQQVDYIISSEIKSELILQFTANAATGKNTSSQALADDLKERCDLNLSPRTISFHIKKLGLSKLKNKVSQLIKSKKKNE